MKQPVCVAVLAVIEFLSLASPLTSLCCPSGCRRLPAEEGGCDAQVLDAHHAGTLGLLRLGLHLLVDFRHVHVLPGGILQKVCPKPTIYTPYTPSSNTLSSDDLI